MTQRVRGYRRRPVIEKTICTGLGADVEYVTIAVVVGRQRWLVRAALDFASLHVGIHHDLSSLKLAAELLQFAHLGIEPGRCTRDDRKAPFESNHLIAPLTKRNAAVN